MDSVTWAHFHLEFHPGLVEEAVLLHMEGHSEAGEFRQARDGVYDLADEEERERRFRKLHQQWFLHLGMDQPVAGALGEQPKLLQGTRGCYVSLVFSSKQEGADLHGSSPKTVVLKLRAARLLDGPALRTFLRHEFMHLADMLDPCFGYKPELPRSEVGPAYDNLIRGRYRVLWDTWIEGRLLRRGWAAQGVREQRLAEFRAVFSMLGESCEANFSQWFHGPFRTHQELLRFALDPQGTSGDQELKNPGSARCPLCQFPSFDLEEGKDLPAAVLKEILVDVPTWKPGQGLCRQCRDLYLGRPLSRSAEATLPNAQGSI